MDSRSLSDQLDPCRAQEGGNGLEQGWANGDGAGKRADQVLKGGSGTCRNLTPFPGVNTDLRQL